MTLRTSQNLPGEYWLPVGGEMSGIWTPLKNRCNTAQEVIRTTGSHQSSRKSLRSSQYFRRRIQENKQNPSDDGFLDKDFEEMVVLGEAKLPIEKIAAETVGFKFLNTEIGNNIYPEQTIELNYDVKVKY